MGPPGEAASPWAIARDAQPIPQLITHGRPREKNNIFLIYNIKIAKCCMAVWKLLTIGDLGNLPHETSYLHRFTPCFF